MNSMNTMNRSAQPGDRPARLEAPLVDVFENDEALLLRADLPGVSPEHLVVELDDGLLTIGGRRPLRPGAADGRILEYSRRFRVSKDVDGSKVSARFEHGVLEVTLPKAESSRPRKIPVRLG